MVFLSNLCDRILEKQKLRKGMMDLGLICIIMRPTGPAGAIGPQWIQGKTDLKDKRITNYDLDRKLTEAYNIILEVKNDHEELNTKEFNKDLKEIDRLNETLTSCKTYYNNNTGELNKLIRKVPTNLIAKIHGYKIKPFFDGKNMQDAVIDDFKL